MTNKNSYIFSIKEDIKSTSDLMLDDEFMDKLIKELTGTGLDQAKKELILKIIRSQRKIHNGVVSGIINEQDVSEIYKSVRTPEHAKSKPSPESNSTSSAGQTGKQHKENSDTEINSPSEEEEDSSLKNDPSKDKNSRKKKRGGKRKGEGKRNLSKFIDSAPIITHSFPEDFIETFSCPCCAAKDSSYKIDPSTNVYFKRVTPVSPEIHVREKRRCYSCGVTLVARASEEVENRVGSFLPSAVTFSILMRYQFGFPFYRMERLLDHFDPTLDFSDATQWDFTQKMATALEPLLDRLHVEAANAQWMGVDDSWARVVSLKKEIKQELETAKNKNDVRTGIETTTFVAKTFSGHTVQFYMTGRNHQSENRAKIIELRTNPKPLITMSDATNKARVKTVSPSGSKIIETHCIEHLRTYFEKIVKDYPDECKYFLSKIAEIYVHDDYCKEQGFNPLARLAYHQTYSQKIMDELYDWIIVEMKNNPFAEPNGNYHKALHYADRFWKEFTEFLRTPGVQLDNNSVERGTKTPVLHRKNSNKFLTVFGAFVGDLFMSIITTALINKINCAEYLEFCITYRDILKDDPELFLPWNYLETKKEIEEQQKNWPPYKIASQRNAFDPQEELFSVQ